MRRQRQSSRLIGLDLPLAFFTLSAILGLWPAYDRDLCWHTLFVLIAGFLFYVLTSRLAAARVWWLAIATVIVLTGVILSLYFVTQYGHFGYPEKVGAIDRLGAFVATIFPPAVFWTPVANSVATYLEGVVFLAVGLALARDGWAWRVGGAVSAGLILLALLMSASRGAWLAVLVAAMLWVALHWRPARAVAIVGAVLALGLVIYVIVQGDITTLGDIPIVDRTVAPMFIRPDRLHVYRNSLYLIQDFPLTGIGLGEQFAMVLSKYALLIRVPFLTYSHNLYLEVWLEQGLLGAAVWLWLMVALYQAARTHGKPGPGFLYQGTWLGLTAIFVHGLSDARQYVDLWCWLPFFGLLGLNAAIQVRRAPAVPHGRRWVLPAATVGLFLVAVGASLHPLPATWHANLGSVRQAHGDLLPSLSDGERARLRREAAEHYRRSIQIASSNRTAQQRLGWMLVDENRFHEAVEHLEVAWQADPDNTTTQKALGLAYVWVGELERAQPLLQGVTDIVQELNTWGWWRGTEGQTEQAINAYRMSLLLSPDQPTVREKLDQLDAESTS